MTNEDIFNLLDYPKVRAHCPTESNDVEVLRRAAPTEFIFALERFGKSLPKADSAYFEHRVFLDNGFLYLVKIKKPKKSEVAGRKVAA